MVVALEELLAQEDPELEVCFDEKVERVLDYYCYCTDFCHCKVRKVYNIKSMI